MGRKFIDLTGQVFGRLTVISLKHINTDTGANWLCICRCGNKVIVPAYRLRNKHTQSCGCYKKEKTHEKLFEDLTERIYGRLKVISFDKIEKNKTFWLCQCTCGNKISVRATDLKNRKTQSCGCLGLESSSNNGKLRKIDLGNYILDA